jgi:molybdopterin synthase sulfur carrier subunit
MEMTVLLFGRLAEIAGTAKLIIPAVEDTGALAAVIHERYPEMATVRYIMAVDRQTVTSPVLLTAQNSVALLPPFSGG